MQEDQKAELKEQLDRFYHTYDRVYLRTDPLKFLHRFGKPEDQEIVGLLASSLAYGRVEQINRTLERVLDVMEGSPYSFTTQFVPSKHTGLFTAIRHRFHTGQDIAALVYAMRQMIEGWGTIENFFISQSTEGEVDMGSRLENFSKGALNLDYSPYLSLEETISPGIRFFFPLPSKGSACKRLNLFLRWMVRSGDEIDLGLWRSISPSEIMIPLDTHVSRVSYAIDLTKYRHPSWKAALEVTSSLLNFDPDDPVKYDFSLCRLGILKECPARREASKCQPCSLRGICRYPALLEVDV
jgi:uncharacterized protein (TIGR02757 family)